MVSLKARQKNGIIFKLFFIIQYLEQTAHTAIQAGNGLVVLGQLRPNLGHIAQEGWYDDLILRITLFGVTRKRGRRVAKMVRAQRMLFQNTGPVWIHGTPVKKKRLVPPDKLMTSFRHADVVTAKCSGGMSPVKREQGVRRVMLLAHATGAIPAFF